MGLFKPIIAQKLQKGYDYDNVHDVEGNRLRVQMNITRNFDMPVLHEILDGKKDLKVLDIGCNEGDNSMDRLAGFDIACYIGVDRSAVAINNAKSKYKDDQTHFYKLDVSEPDVAVDLTGILQRNRIERVDVIMVSMVLLHLENPKKLLRTLYPFLAPGGVIFVKDIDDRDNRADPDPGHIFDRGYEIVDRCGESGNRHIGREIGGWLTDAGYQKVKCVRRGLSTLGMSNDERLALYETYFGFFMCDAEARVDKNPTDEQALADLGWCCYYLPKIKDTFVMPGFNFTLGFTTYIATKE